MKSLLTSSAFLALLLPCGSDAFCQKLIAYYPFDANARDSSGHGNHGEMIGGVEVTADRFGNACGALSFNGTDGYIEVPNSNSLRSPVSALTITCWFKIEVAPVSSDKKWLTMLSKGNEPNETDNNPQYRLQVLQTATQSTISISSDFTEFDNNYLNHPFSIGKWSFYAMVYDGTNVRTYFNGREVWIFPYRKSFRANDMPMHIAKDIPGVTEFFCGSLDDLRIYNSALTEKEILQLFNDQSGASFNQVFTLTCPSNIIVSTESGKCLAQVNYQQPLVNVNCGSANIRLLNGLASGSQFPLGSSVITYLAESSFGKKQVCSFNVIVKDNAAPLIKCPLDTVVILNDEQGKIFSYGMPLAFDNCSIADIKLLSGLPSGSFFPIGKNALSFRAADQSGNQSDCSFNVIIRKTQISSDTSQAQVKITPKQKVVNTDVINYEHQLTFNDCIITVVMYDDAQQDFDTVSIFYNDKLIVDRQMIWLKKNETITRVLVLNPDEKNYLISKAWNTGQISPNTLKIEFYEGNLLKDKKKFKKAKPIQVKILHSKPGGSGAIVLKCNL